MCHNKTVHLNQTKTPVGTEVTTVWSGSVYIGEGFAAVCRKCFSGLNIVINFSEKNGASGLSCIVFHVNL